MSDYGVGEMGSETCPVAQSDRQRRGWHIKREIDLGFISVSVLMLAGLFVWAMSQERRLNTEENATVYTNKEIRELKEAVARDKAETRDDIKDIKRILEDIRNSRRN